MRTHLNMTYPRNRAKEYLSSEWLTEVKYRNSYALSFAKMNQLKGNGRCPKHMKPYIFRYLHDNSLYNTHQSNLGEVEKFMYYLIENLRIKCDGFNMRLYERCKKRVANSARTFLEQGLLIRKEGVLQRTAAFDRAWIQRRTIWQAYTQAVSRVDDSTDPKMPAGAKQGEVQKQKRVMQYISIYSGKD